MFVCLRLCLAFCLCPQVMLRHPRRREEEGENREEEEEEEEEEERKQRREEPSSPVCDFLCVFLCCRLPWSPPPARERGEGVDLLVSSPVLLFTGGAWFHTLLVVVARGQTRHHPSSRCRHCFRSIFLYFSFGLCVLFEFIVFFLLLLFAKCN